MDSEMFQHNFETRNHAYQNENFFVFDSKLKYSLALEKYNWVWLEERSRVEKTNFYTHVWIPIKIQYFPAR